LILSVSAVQADPAAINSDLQPMAPALDPARTMRTRLPNAEVGGLVPVAKNKNGPAVQRSGAPAFAVTVAGLNAPSANLQAVVDPIATRLQKENAAVEPPPPGPAKSKGPIGEIPPMAAAETDWFFKNAVYLGDIMPTEREQLYLQRAASVEYTNHPSPEVVRDLADLSGINYLMPQLDPKPISLKMTRNPFRMLETVVSSLGMGLVKRDDVWLISEVDRKTLVPHVYELKHIHLDREISFRESGKSGSMQSAPTSTTQTPVGGLGGASGSNAGTYEKVTDRASSLPPRSASERSSDNSIVRRIREIIGGPGDASPALLRAESRGSDKVANADGSSVDYDPDSNSLFVVTTEEKYAWVREYLDSKDVEPVNVEVVVQFISTGRSKGGQTGVNWAGPSSGKTRGLGSGVPVTLGSRVGEERALGGSVVTTTNDGPLVFGDLGDLKMPSAILSATGLQARLSLLLANTDTKVKRRPKLVAENNREMVFNLTQNRPVAVNSNTTNNTGGGGAVTTSGVNVSNENIGTVMRIIPQRIRGDVVKLSIQLEVTNVASTVVVGGSEYPIINRTSVNSSPVLRSGYSVELGGLQEMITSNTVQKIPLLGDMPVFGFAFKEVVKNDELNELSILITVRLLDDTGNEIVRPAEKVVATEPPGQAEEGLGREPVRAVRISDGSP
jgi:hypothetical protein